MTDLRSAPLSYPEGGRFPGVIGRTQAESTPAWPEPVRAPDGAPNVLVVLLDDVGFAQLGCFGANIRTPTSDRLAANGVRYRNFRTTALCTPSRATLLTGRNHHVNHCGALPDFPRGFPGYDTVIPRESGFVSEVLRGHGYATFALGKWHLTPYSETAPGSSHARWPLGRGFDRFYGFLGGRTSQWVPSLIYDNHAVEPPATPRDGYHLNVDLADRAIEFVSDLRAADPERPFFMYYGPGAGHAPHHVPRDWADRYAGQFDLGWDRWREEVFNRQVEAGVVPADTTLSSRPTSIAAWDSLGDVERRLCARQMEVYAGFLEHTDYHVGRLIDFLEHTGDLDNTLVLLTSDNGASGAGGPYGRNGLSTDLAANLARIEQWGGPNSDPDYASGWGWAGNTPFRRWKQHVHEGGVSDPLIVHWPAGIRARGEIRTQYAHITDVAPTILESLGIDWPDRIEGVPQRPVQGVSFAHTFDDPDAPTNKRVQYYEMGGSRALWAQGWKAVAEHTGSAALDEETLARQRWELYDLATDFSESHDRADDEPGKLRELTELWWAEAGSNDVLPLDGRHRVDPPRSRRPRYVYYPNAAPVPSTVAADLTDTSFQITAHVQLANADDKGVLLAHGGGVLGGYAFYVKAGRLHFVHNYAGTDEQRVSSDERLMPGNHTLAVTFTKTGHCEGTALLSVDGHQVGESSIARTMPTMIGKCNEGLCCGYDSGEPVARDYQAPFRFTGHIDRVVVEINSERTQITTT